MEIKAAKDSTSGIFATFSVMMIITISGENRRDLQRERLRFQERDMLSLLDSQLTVTAFILMKREGSTLSTPV